LKHENYGYVHFIVVPHVRNSYEMNVTKSARTLTHFIMRTHFTFF